MTRLNSKQCQLMEILMTWRKRTVQYRITELSKAFYRWKYCHIGVDEAVDGEGVAVQRGTPLGEQKNSYLMLFAENEKLREHLSEMRRSSAQQEKHLRARAVKGMIGLIFRSRLSSKKRYYFDLWLNNSRMTTLVGDTRQKSMELSIGLQKIDSERNYVTTLEKLNSQLKLSLSLTVYFYKWKSRTASMIMQEERRMHDKQRRIIYNELLRIRRIVTNANQQEVALLSGALRRGEQLSDSLHDLNKQMTKAVRLGSKNSKPSHQRNHEQHTGQQPQIQQIQQIQQQQQHDVARM